MHLTLYTGACTNGIGNAPERRLLNRTGDRTDSPLERWRAHVANGSIECTVHETARNKLRPRLHPALTHTDTVYPQTRLARSPPLHTTSYNHNLSRREVRRVQKSSSAGFSGTFALTTLVSPLSTASPPPSPKTPFSPVPPSSCTSFSVPLCTQRTRLLHQRAGKPIHQRSPTRRSSASQAYLR